MAEEQKPRGKYWTHVEPKFNVIKKWLLDGLTEEQIYTNLRVGKTSWYDYKNKYPELNELVKKGKEGMVAEVENSLFKLAVGFHYETDEVHKVKDPDGFDVLQVVRVLKYKPPETGACAIILKNRGDYSDNPQIVRIKQEELELKKQMARFQMF